MTYSSHDFESHCDTLRASHAIIQRLHERDGYPPFWNRGNGFEALAKTIIEQQVSLSSANASVARLRNTLGTINAVTIDEASDEVIKACGITRQKTRYLKLLAETIIAEPDYFDTLAQLEDEAARKKLLSLKGIGLWTANVYMLDALNRINVYPDYDVALIKSIAYEVFDHAPLSNQEASEYILQFAPRQSIACCYFYNAYILRKKAPFIP